MTVEARFKFQRDAFALDVELAAPARGVTALFGPSGCGKTTLLRLIAGLEHDPGGYLSVAGDVWQDRTTVVPTHARPLGYVFQEANVFPHLSVRRNLEYGHARVKHERRVAFDDAVELLGLGSMLDRRSTGLSGGEQQRVAIARTLLRSPRLLLMDEPMSALDTESRAEIIPFLERLHETLEIPVIYVSHALDEVARLADHLVLMEAGRVLLSGPLVETLGRLDSPLARIADAESVIEAKVAAHDDEYQLTRLDFAGGQFTVAGTAVPIGRDVRVRVLARDVSLALERPTGTSILNVLPATVRATRDDGTAQVLVQLDLGAATILARITRKSATTLAIEPGKPLFAQVKSVALLGP